MDTATARCDCARCTAHDEGRRGPFSPREFYEIFGVVNAGDGREPSPELEALAVAHAETVRRLDEAREAFRLADIEVHDAAVRAHGKETAELETAQEAARDARLDFDDASDDELEMRQAYFRQAASDTAARYAAERAAAEVEAEAARIAAAEARRQASGRRVLTRLRGVKGLSA